MRSKTLIERIIFNPIIQTFVIFISGGWIVLEITEYFIENFGLNEKARNIALIVLLVSLPVAILFAWYLNRKKRKIDETARGELANRIKKIPDKTSQSLVINYTKPQILIPGILIVLAIGISLFFRMRHQSRVLWAKGTAIPEISRLVDERNWGKALHLAQQAERYIPNDSILDKFWPAFSRRITIHSEPQGAKVFYRPFKLVNVAWEYMGETPCDSIRFPYGRYRIQIRKEAYHQADAGVDLYSFDSLHFQLVKEDQDPHSMVLIPGGKNYSFLPGFKDWEQIEFAPFLMDKYEVTNTAFKKFVEDGGYEKREYWKQDFFNEGNNLSWEEAMAIFVDATGRPGPATWEVGNYPDGKGNYPVTGICWYEAAAYAEFAGKSLPTIYNWNFAANLNWSAEIVPFSNFDGEAAAPVGSYPGMSPYGVFDMAGNAREWCWNESSDLRVIMGGGWNDQIYMFNIPYAMSPINRSESNGFRCMQYLDQAINKEFLMEPVEHRFRNFLNEPQVSDEVFTMFLQQYAYDKTELNAVVESVKVEEEYTREKISFDAAYGNERMAAYLMLPETRIPPFQTVLYFPGAGAIFEDSSEYLGVTRMAKMILKSGRAVLCPVYKSTYERRDELQTNLPDNTQQYKEHVIMWVRDLSRSVDYLETRDEIDTENLAFYGVSWGGSMGGIIPAVETRIKASVLVYAGLWSQQSMPEVDPVHYLPRIPTPVLMLNGRYDYMFPYEHSQLPFYTLLGTPIENKKLQLYEYAHTVPTIRYAKEMLAWLDKYLGPVNKSPR